ncbi:MAG: class I SAM-dependent methyltransferase [Rickettsiales bacterium]|nr:class I SAM-dependent methyltransferase [Rickettsiales bacterium]
MFHPDVVSFRQWYSSPLGSRVRIELGNAMRRFWPDCRGDMLAGLGFTLPYLRIFQQDSSAVLPMMLREQGAIYWPADGDNRSLLVQDSALPLGDNMAQRLIVIHTLEHSHHVINVLKEVWRVLAPGGRVLLIVPNRRGIWSQSASTPFGCGQPYTAMQLRHRAYAVGLTFVDTMNALYFPPLTWKWMLALAPCWELLGRLFLPGAGGVVLLEMEKQIYASIPEPIHAPRHALFPAQAIAQPR